LFSPVRLRWRDVLAAAPETPGGAAILAMPGRGERASRGRPAILLLPAAGPREIVRESGAQIVARHVAERVRTGEVEALLVANHGAPSAASVVDPRRQSSELGQRGRYVVEGGEMPGADVDDVPGERRGARDEGEAAGGILDVGDLQAAGGPPR